MFRTLQTLGQKAGVPANRLRRLVLKELVDNALDAGALVTIEETAGVYTIQDDGPGIAGTPDEVARLFSIDRPMVSSKQWRKPQRGALGNGLRVVAGAIIASGGDAAGLTIWTRGYRLDVMPLGDGGASVVAEPIDFPIGTKIEISFGPFMPKDEDALAWAGAAIDMAQGGDEYSGKSSPHWFDADAFYELVHSSGKLPVRALVTNLDGCTGAKAAAVTGGFKGRSCDSMSSAETSTLLKAAQALTTAPNVKKLGAVGKIDTLPEYHAHESGVVTLGEREPKAQIPFVVEAWAEVDKDETTIVAHVNRTPITGDVRIGPCDKGKPAIWGCGLAHYLDIPKAGKWRVVLNVTTPFMPITTDGKAPHLEPFWRSIVGAVQGAIKRARKATPKGGEDGSIKNVVIANLDLALSKVTGGGKYRVAQRQLFYAMRPIIIRELGQELKWGTFTGIITDLEMESGEIDSLYRDNRGVLYQPGTGGPDIPLGTLMAESYERPAWTFNKIVYIEKQAFFESLKATCWPERHDCALITSKGFTTRAVKDIVDHLVEHDEPVKVFCVHDADSAGTMIFQTLQYKTPARAARNVEIVNFGLEPWDARDMGLEPERFEKTDKRRPVAEYVTRRDDGAYWGEWLQSNRYELDAMTTPQFLEWITAKIEEHGVGKVIPPPEVIAAEADYHLEAELRERITERVLREADVDSLVAAELAAIPRMNLTCDEVDEWLAQNPLSSWRGYVDERVIKPLGFREL